MYTLRSFSDFELPDRMFSQDIGTGQFITAPFNLSSGGAYDGLGLTAEAVPGSRKFQKTALFWFATESERIQFFRDLRSYVGKREKLVRQWQDDTQEWVDCRFISVTAQRELENQQHLEVDMIFEIYSDVWHADLVGSWTFDSGERLDTGLELDSSADEFTLNTNTKLVTVTPTGNAIIKDCIITITAGSTDITSLNISTDEIELEWSGTLAVGESLVIDCGAYTVYNDGVNDEDNFSLGSDHAINEWFRLNPEDNDITIVKIGGSTNSTIEFSYYNAEK